MERPQTLRILFVDDYDDFSEALSALLRLEGHTVTTANNGRSAVLLAHSLQPDVVLLDLALPELDGYSAARSIRERSPAARLIAVSGFTDHQTQKRAAAAGFDAFLSKPIDLGRLRGLLHRSED